MFRRVSKLLYLSTDSRYALMRYQGLWEVWAVVGVTSWLRLGAADTVGDAKRLVQSHRWGLLAAGGAA